MNRKRHTLLRHDNSLLPFSPLDCDRRTGHLLRSARWTLHKLMSRHMRLRAHVLVLKSLDRVLRMMILLRSWCSDQLMGSDYGSRVNKETMVVRPCRTVALRGSSCTADAGHEIQKVREGREQRSVTSKTSSAIAKASLPHAAEVRSGGPTRLRRPGERKIERTTHMVRHTARLHLTINCAQMLCQCDGGKIFGWPVTGCEERPTHNLKIARTRPKH